MLEEYCPNFKSIHISDCGEENNLEKKAIPTFIPAAWFQSGLKDRRCKDFSTLKIRLHFL